MMTVKGMRKLLGYTQKKFCESYKIPRRTLENWEYGIGKPPIYVLYLLERAVLEDYKKMKEE